MTEKELKKLFEQKLEGLDFEFNEANWEAFEQMSDPSQPLSEQEYKKLFRDKMAQASFPFNPSNWEAMEAELGPEHGMSDQELQDLFNKKISESEFTFNPDNWNRMEAILDQKAKRPLAFFWRSAAAILIAAGLSSILLWQNQGLSPKSLPINEGTVESQVVRETIKTTSPADVPLSPTKGEKVNTNKPKTSGNTTEPPVGKTLATNEVSGQTYIQDGLAALSGVKPLNDSPDVLEVVEGPPPSVWNELPLIQPENPLVMSVGDAPVVDYIPLDEPYVPIRYSKVFAVGGTGLSQAMNGRVGSPGWQIGLEYEYGWNEKVALRTGLIYAQSGDIGLETLHDSTFFGLGRTEVHTHRHYKSLKTLQIPISYQYQISPKHRFGLGLQTDILLSVVMDQTKTTSIFKQDPTVEESHFDQQMNSFEPINFYAQLNYEFQYSDRLSLGFSYAFALNDITKDHAQDFEADHRPGQANLQLRYRLFEK